ncbi:MAG: immunity protein 32 [Parachlamydiaceae bacterium]|nr:immunity protein 32 [Parachlamydiaceae bacterium]
MTSDWGGNELSSEKQNQESEIINHVKIFKWIASG